MGAAIAYYMVFSLAPILVMVIAVAGLAFGQKAAEGALFGELADLIGPESAVAVQAMLRSASDTGSGIFATAVAIGALIIAATAVLGELQSALNVIWKVPPRGGLGIWRFLKSRPPTLAIIVAIDCLPFAPLVITTASAAYSDRRQALLEARQTTRATV